MKSRIVAALLVGLCATTISYAAEPAISTVNPVAVETTDDTNVVAQDSANASNDGSVDETGEVILYNSGKQLVRTKALCRVSLRII